MIDWNKPLQGINGEEFKKTGCDERFVYGTAGGWAGIWSLELGEPISPLAHHVAPLRNIPEEPEWEEGWYWFLGVGGDWKVTHSNNIAKHSTDVFERIYAPDEYRPADKFPPPMDGTLFEVLGSYTNSNLGIWGIPMPEANKPCFASNDKGTKASLTWVLERSWRPVQK